ncbi:hypothetical protein ACFVKB_45230, partial [Rhodococcus sp. NPDC127530]
VNDRRLRGGIWTSFQRDRNPANSVSTFRGKPHSGPATVHPGSFCSGGTGVSSTGKPMVCATAKDGKMRWQSAN